MMAAITATGNLVIDSKQILAFIPHRYPFLMIDRVIEWQAKKYLIAIKNVTVNEPCFTGHFPENPIFPGVLIVEALAQAAGILSFKSNEVLAADDQESKRYLYLFAGIEKARFRKLVIPGDQLQLKVELVRNRQGLAMFSGFATVNDRLVCSSELLIAQKRAADE